MHRTWARILLAIAFISFWVPVFFPNSLEVAVASYGTIGLSLAVCLLIYLHDYPMIDKRYHKL